MTGTNCIKTLISGTALIAVMACAEEPQYSAERYDVILDRSPFGSDPLLDVVNSKQKEAEAAAAAAAATAAANELRLCFLYESESGEVRAGFQHLKAKPGSPKSIILCIGESFMGMKLLNIDLVESQATLESRGKPVIFQLTKAPLSAKAPAATPEPPKRQFGGGFRSQAPPPEQPPEPKLSPEEEQLRREEIRANLQNYQMEVIRSGMPPLPIPLTKEMDDQLVIEGFLPPAEVSE